MTIVQAGLRGVTFVLGFSFSLLPSFAPFLGLLFVAAARFRLRQQDLWWLATALLLSVPLALTEGLRGGGFGIAQVLAAWLLYRAFQELPGTTRIDADAISFGLVAGFLTVTAIGLLDIERIETLFAATVAQSLVWRESPALFAHTTVALGALLSITVRKGYLRLACLAIAAAGVLAAGSREAAMAWLIAAAVVVFRRRTRPRVRILSAALVGVMLLVAAGFGPRLGWGNVGFLLDVWPERASVNVFQGTEDPYGDWWYVQGVGFESQSAVLAGAERTVYAVTKVEPEHWRRLQQIIPIRSGSAYTLSAWIEPTRSAVPGFQGYGMVRPDAEPFIVTARYERQAWTATIQGPGRLLDAKVIDADGGWVRVAVSFVYEGDGAPLPWWVGFVPDQRFGTGTTVRMAGLQLEERAEASPYAPGSATRGLSLARGRVPVWDIAARGALERPLTGWGRDAFGPHVDRDEHVAATLGAWPAHAHNLFLYAAFERGLMGLAGLLLLLGLVFAPAARAGDFSFVGIAGVVLVLNAFDATLLHGAILYPLVAIAAWRSRTFRPTPAEQTRSGQLGVRLTLACADFAAAATALALAILLPLGPLAAAESAATTGTIFAALGYALLLWPALALREGLYPGYGLTEAAELRKSVVAAASAGALFLFALLLFPDVVGLSLSQALMLALLAVLLAPPFRVLAKRVLLRLDLWGRDVVIVGRGAVAERVATALSRRRLDGLRPVAIFGPAAPSAPGPVPYLGDIDGVYDYAAEHLIEHAIVALPETDGDEIQQLIERLSATFRRVQFIPNLASLPSHGVYASDLDRMLALELHVGLLDPMNRWFKRTFDVCVGAVVGLALLPVIAVIALWVRLDSIGPAFHRSKRIGAGGESFACLKFRTMHLDAERRLGALLAHNMELRSEYETFHKMEHDPRVTRAGRWLRRFSLDELPQLWNVLAGDMSLSGPRPYLEREQGEMGRLGDVIHRARPGITGLWQVSGRNMVTFQDRLEMEAYYVRNWSIWWDLVLLAKTLPTVLSRRGAR